MKSSYKHRPTYLVCATYRKKGVYILSPNTYGFDTWGTTSQDSLEFKRKYWYTTSWTYGGEWYDDQVYEFRLNVLLETKSSHEVFKFVKKNYPHCFKDVEDDIAQIVNDYNAIRSWSKKHE